MLIFFFLSTTRKCRANIIPYRPNTSSIYYPDKTEVKITTRENIYVYAMYKLWLAYGLAIGATALTAIFGMAAIIANHASFSNRFSPEQMAGTRDSIAYTLVDRKGGNNGVKNQVVKNENVMEGLFDSPDAPLEQAYLHTNLVANAGEGRESNWAANIQHLISNAQAQISTQYIFYNNQ